MKTALWTTHADLSLELLRPYVTDIYYYDESLESPSGYDQVYFRDPFNDPASPTSDERLMQVLTEFFEKNPQAYSLDGIREVQDFYLEDKYLQYQKFGSDVMPETVLATEIGEWREGLILKKRISCRSRDIYFAVPEFGLTEDYIVQRRERIRQELRAFYVRGKVCAVAEIRSTKTETQKVKALGWRELTKEEMDFIAQAMQKMPKLDFVGVDLALLEDGRKVLIEVNRSPQFAAYYRITGTNVADELFS